MWHTITKSITLFLTTISSFFVPLFSSTIQTSPIVSSSIPIAYTETIASTTPPTIEKSAVTATTTEKIKKVPIQNTKTVKQTPSPERKSTQLVTNTPEETQSPIDFETINTNTRTSVINILCTNNSEYNFSGATGSGVVLSSAGVILTNAHLGQYLLLQNINGKKDTVECIARTGSPAYPRYTLKLLYIPPVWVEKNNTVLVSENPTGTGEHDYAFLKIVSHTDGTPIQEKIPYLPINIGNSLYEGNNVLLASYPAGFLGGISIEKNLYQSSAITQIKKLYTFASTSIDLISVPGTVISQRGSSGGAVVNAKGQLTGLITTSTEADTTGARDLRALTMFYINNDLLSQSSINFMYILEHPDETGDVFNKTLGSNLTKILTTEIMK